MKVAVVGCRTFADYPRLCADLDKARAKWGDFTVISGGARGADSLAERWAGEWGLPFEGFPADWDRFGKRAGFLRNEQIVLASDCVIAYWDGESRGTGHTVRLAGEAGKPVYIRSI